MDGAAMTDEAKVLLVVDDDEMVRDAAVESLRDQGFQVHAATNGLEALDLLATIRPDLIVTDWMMPVMSGAELVAALRADAALAKIPVIVFTASHFARVD